jgi:hypothetical protein
MKSRKKVPRPEEKLPQPEYWRRIHESQYVLSPDGDRPECHRHYEAIGLGTMPITSLDPTMYRHLHGNVVFDEHDWNVTELEKKLPRDPPVNRRLVFEEYWMEYVERELGRPMRWWDPSRDVRRSLVDITEHVDSTGEERLLKSHTDSNAKQLAGEHYPSYFSDQVPLEKLVARKNLLTVYSGCSIAAFFFNGDWHPEDVLKDCQRYKGTKGYDAHHISNETMAQLQPYDSIYVPIVSLGEFVTEILPHINSDIVLITGQNSNVPPIRKEVYDTLIDHPRIARWFLQNLSEYSYDARHPKVRRQARVALCSLS